MNNYQPDTKVTWDYKTNEIGGFFAVRTSPDRPTRGVWPDTGSPATCWFGRTTFMLPKHIPVNVDHFAARQIGECVHIEVRRNGWFCKCRLSDAVRQVWPGNSYSAQRALALGELYFSPELENSEIDKFGELTRARLIGLALVTTPALCPSDQWYRQGVN